MIFDILSLPTEVIIEVFKNMGWRDILRASETCRAFFKLAQDRSVWISLLRDDSSTLLHRPIVEAPVDEYTTQELKNIVLRTISGTVGWNSSRQPHERTTPKGDFPVGDGRKVLLEGGRWLLSFGRNLINYNPEYHRAILAYDLDSPRFASTILYKDTSPETGTELIAMYPEVDRSKSCLAFTLGLLFSNANDSHTPKRLDVLGIEQRSRGPDAKLVISTINSLTCGDVYDMVGDYVRLASVGFGDTYEKVKVLNWRTSSSSRHWSSTLNLKWGALCRLLPGKKIFAFEDIHKIAIYKMPGFRWTTPLEVSPAGEHFQDPIWSASLPPEVHRYSPVHLSKPFCGPITTRLVFLRNDRIYGLVIPHDGRTPVLHILATAPALSTWKHPVDICVDKIYCEMESGPCTLAFSWPEEAALAEPTAWVPPILHFTIKRFAGHHTSIMRGYDLVDEVSGRVVTGSKYERHGIAENRWSGMVGYHILVSRGLFPSSIFAVVVQP